jgi:hypothetical protein
MRIATTTIVNGYAYQGATTVRIRLSNGKTQTLLVVEGLFLGALHQSTHWRRRPKIVSVIARTHTTRSSAIGGGHPIERSRRAPRSGQRPSHPRPF